MIGGGHGSPPGPADEIDSGDVTALDVLPGDDVAVVCGWIDAAPTDSVVLYVMRGNGQLASELGMRRLAHHAAESGRSVAIVTRSWSLAGRARQAGIPVAGRIDRVRWDAGGHRVVWLGSSSVRLPRAGRYGPALVILAALGVMAWLALSMAPAATVTFAPPQDQFARTLTVSVSASRTTVDIPRLLLPGRTVTVSHTITLARRTTGSTTAPTGRARVELTVTNGGVDDVSLPAGAVLLAGEDGPLFTLDRPAQLPAGGTLGVTATALAPGPVGNVPPGAIDRWRDAAYSTVTVTNPAAAAGGADGPVPAVAPEDIAAITAEAEALAASASLLTLALSERSADAVLPRTASATVTFDDPADLLGMPADTLLLPVTYTVSALAIPGEAIDELARALLAPPGARSVFVPGSARASDTGAVNGRDADGGELAEVELRAAFTRDVVPGDVKDLVKGRSQSGARVSIEERYGIADAEVDLAPGWAPWVPRFGFRIDVRFRPPAPPGGDAAEGEPSHGSATANASPRP